MRSIVKRAALVAGAAAGAYVLRPGTRGHRLARKGIDVVDSRVRYTGGRLTGIRYRLRGGHPATGADDSVIADRVRSVLGGVTKRLDLPHVNVMVEDGIAVLHGVVSHPSDAITIEHGALGVYGVSGVESYLHVGLTEGDTRPSAGLAEPSALMRELLAAAAGAGIAQQAAPVYVRMVLGAFADRLPKGERAHVAAHLPHDVASLLVPPRRRGQHPVRTMAAFTGRVASAAGEGSAEDALAVSVAVLRTLRGAVPDEAADVYAVLPADLHALWPKASPRG